MGSWLVFHPILRQHREYQEKETADARAQSIHARGTDEHACRNQIAFSANMDQEQKAPAFILISHLVLNLKHFPCILKSHFRNKCQDNDRNVLRQSALAAAQLT